MLASVPPSEAVFIEAGYQELYVPAIAEQQVFIEKAGSEVLSQMYTFTDKGGRAACLIPEATALIQKQWRDAWSKTMPRPMRVFYLQRCYRYDRPQRGRYREFTQAGIEILGGQAPQDGREAIQMLQTCLDLVGVDYSLKTSVKRGLSYYIEDGFEAEVASLGAQKQVAGGGRYAEGIGWAIGVDRLVLALEQDKDLSEGEQA